MKQLNLALFCLPILLLSGCLESEDRFVLNPDGSGKVEHQAVFQIMNLNLGGGQEDPEKNARRAVQTLLNESAGIEAWSNVSYAIQPDGRVAFKGTAYFRDLSTLEFKHGNISMDMMKPTFQQENGKGILQLKWDDTSSGQANTGAKAEGVEWNEERLAAERGKFQQMKPMMAAMLGGMKVRQTFVLPGTIEVATNFEKPGGNEVAWGLSGQEMLDLIDQLIMDDAWLKAQLETGKSMGQDFNPDATLNEGLFGSPGPVQATVAAPMKPAFDYDTEVEAAVAATPAMLDRLGIKAPAVTAAKGPPEPGSGFSDLHLGGVRWVEDTGYDDARPFNWTPGITFALVGTFQGAVLDVTEVNVEKIETTSGESLLPESEFERKSQFNSLSDDGTTVVVEAKGKMPQQDAAGIREISGQATYQTSSATKEVDLGLSSLALDAAGTELGATISRRDEQNWGNRTNYTLTLALEVPQNVVKEILFFNEQGQPMELNPSGYSASNDSVSLNFSSESPIPEKGSAKAVLYDDLKSYVIPFEVKNVSWMGKELSP